MSSKKVIPRRDWDFDVMQQRVRTLAEATATRWGLDAAWMQGVFVPAAAKWKTAYEAWLDPTTRTRVFTALKNKARMDYEPLLRILIAGLKANTRVDLFDRNALGFAERDRTMTPSPVPDTVPMAEVRLPAPAVVDLHYYDSGHTQGRKRARPAGVRGVEILWAVLDAPPGDDWDLLVHSDFDTATPFRLVFDGNQRGQHLYFALRWENTRGEKGPLSNIREAIIP